MRIYVDEAGNILMYPYMMLRDSTDIVYSQIIEIDGIIAFDVGSIFKSAI